MPNGKSMKTLKHGRPYPVERLHSKMGPIVDAFPNVTHIADLTEPIALTIKECDVKAAKPKSQTQCVMAQALMRLGADGAVVTRSRTYIIIGDLAIRSETRASTGREMTAFDRNASFDEGTYGLSAVCESNSLRTRRHKPHGTPGNGPKKRKSVGVHYTHNIRN